MKAGIAGAMRSGAKALAALTLAGVVTALYAPPPTAVAQEPSGRFRVLVVPLESSALDKKFGEKVAEEIGKRLEDFPTHAPIPEKEFERALKRYEVKREDLSAIKARQLANLMGAQVVFYGTVQPSGGAYEVQASFIDVKTGDEVAVPALTINGKDDQAVEKVTGATVDAFEKQVRFVRARQFCADYVGSQQPENAMRNCNEALEINPNSVPALYNKALAFRQMFENQESAGTNGWADSAVYYFERVLELEPGKRDAIQQLAYLYTQIGQSEKAAELYRQYLELDPGNVPVRLKVAYDMVQADTALMPDAIDIIREGLEYAENDVNLLQSLGDYCLRYSNTDAGYVDCAVDAYEKVLDLKGEETELTIVENALAAFTRADRGQEAVAFAEKALQSHSDSPRLWSLYADALGRLERYADAAAAMDKVIELDPSYQNAYLKRGQFKLQVGNDSAAMADFRQAIETGTSTSADVFSLFWSQAHAARGENKYSTALERFSQAAEFVPAEKRQELHFWWGYTYYQLGEGLAKPDDASLSQLQRALQSFQAAKEHLNQAGSVHQAIPQLRDNSDQWILNVEARIKNLQRQ